MIGAGFDMRNKTSEIGIYRRLLGGFKLLVKRGKLSMSILITEE